MIRRSARLLLPAAALLSAGAARADPAVATPARPSAAIGYDWMDPTAPADAADDPAPWPRPDAAGSGLDDLIHDERRPIEGAIVGAQPGRSIGSAPDQRILRTLRKVGGDYIVVPLFTMHLDRPAH